MAGLNRRGFITGTAGSAAAVPLSGCAVAPTPLEEHSPKNEHTPELGPDPWIELDREALVANLKAIDKRVSQRPIMPVIKANGYGHGLAQIGRALERAGIEQLAVAKVSEAMILRREGIATTVLNLGPFGARDIPDIVAGRVSQTVFTSEVEDLAADARRRGKVTPVHVNVDTGLGRVGVPHGQAVAFIERVASLSGIRLEGVFTGLTEDPEFDKEQVSRFEAVIEGAAAKNVTVGVRHAASSAAVMSFPNAFLDMVRPGIAVFGLYPNEASEKTRPIALRPVLSLKARVVMVKTLAVGDSLSYHRAFVATRPTRVATLPVGYADGYPATAAGKAEVLIGGKRRPVIGLVTANHTLVEIGADDPVAIGDEAVLIGHQRNDEITAAALGKGVGLSAYKIVIGLRAGLPRRFRGV
jgi:alanine racemase